MSGLNLPEPAFMADSDLRLFFDSVGRFFDDHAPPERTARWRADGQVERVFWNEAGAGGLLGVSVPENYGGAGADFRYDLVIFEQLYRKGVSGFAVNLHNGIVTPYIVAHGT